jgi:transposase
VLEPTGRYSQDVARAAREAGRDVRLAQPKKAQLFLKSVQSRAKTDKLDATGLALYALSCDLAPYPLKNDMQEELDQLLLARKGLSQSLCELQARQRELPRAASALAPAVEALQKQLKAIDRQIDRLAKTPEMKAVQELQKVPGIGPVVATTVVSRLRARSFSHPDQFVAYCGLDVRVRQSGKKSGQLGLSKQGEAELRRLLFLAAQASLRGKDSPFAAQYERERAKGLSSTAALCAVARKLARLSWSLVTHGTSYDPDRVYQQNQQPQKPPPAA